MSTVVVSFGVIGASSSTVGFAPASAFSSLSVIGVETSGGSCVDSWEEIGSSDSGLARDIAGESTVGSAEDF